MTPDVTVLVVGTGPTGLLLAGELCRRGVTCQVIDANSGPLHWDRATIVHPRSLEVFESLGIVEPLLAQGVRQRVARVHSAGRALGEIDLSICGSRYGFNIGISEEVTEAILTDYLLKHGGEIARSSRLTGLEQNGDGVVVTIDYNGKTECVAARWVVGCDGVRSTTRTACGIELDGSDHTESWAVFDATLVPWTDSYEATYGYLEKVTVILTSLPERRWRVYVRPSSDDSDLILDAATTLARYHPALRFDDVTHPTRFRCHTRVARRYRSGRVLLAGDAAHVCSPSQGHGMNSGIQDAYNLAWKLALVCQGHSDAALLDSYEAERHPVAEMIAASGAAFDRAQDLRDPAERWARDEALCATFADPTSRHHESVAEAELDIDYSRSPIVLGDAHEKLSPGHRLPDTIAIRHREGKVRFLHELTHRAGHTALVLGGPSTEGDTLARLASSLALESAPPLLEATFVLSPRPLAQHSHFQLPPAAVEALGVGNATLLVIRPDAHVGLRADRDHRAALAKYRQLVTTGRS